MTLSLISYSVALAATAAFVFALLLVLGQVSAVLPRRRAAYTAQLSNAAAAGARSQWRKLGRKRRLVLLPLLFFTVALPALIVAEPPSAITGEPGWQSWATLVAAAIVALAATARVLVLTANRLRLRRVIDARLAIGHALQRISVNHNRTFHDVPTAFGAIDHVIAGLHGIYAVKVYSRRPRRNREVRLDDDELYFGDVESGVSLAGARKIADRLARECAKVLKHEVHVRLVIAVPGWDVHMQSRDDVLVTNERNLNMLVGWKDQRDYLLDEDVETLHRYLDERCACDPGDIG